MSTANPSRPTGRSFRLVCPPEQMPQVESLLRAQGFGDLEITKDLNGIPRVVHGTLWGEI